MKVYTTETKWGEPIDSQEALYREIDELKAQTYETWMHLGELLQKICMHDFQVSDEEGNRICSTCAFICRHPEDQRYEEQGEPWIGCMQCGAILNAQDSVFLVEDDSE